MELSVNRAQPGDREVLNMTCDDGRFTKVCVAPSSDGEPVVSMLVYQSHKGPTVMVRFGLNAAETDLLIKALTDLRKKM